MAVEKIRGQKREREQQCPQKKCTITSTVHGEVADAGQVYKRCLSSQQKIEKIQQKKKQFLGRRKRQSTKEQKGSQTLLIMEVLQNRRRHVVRV